jgi:hypothetical protein
VSNKGSLALKYQLAMTFSDTAVGKNAKDEKIYLSNYLEFGVVTNQESEFTSREAALKAVTNAQKVNSGYSTEFKMGVTDEPSYFALVVYMPESVGNDANYTGTAIPEIKLGISLAAAQDTVEKDSFNEQYDKDAEYTVSIDSASSLYSALANNQDIVLTDDIDLSETDWTRVSYFSGTLDGNGHAIKGLSGSRGLFASIENGTVKNLVIEDAEIQSTSAATGILADRIYGSATIENVTVSGTSNGTSYYTGGMVGAIIYTDEVKFIDCVNNANVTSTSHQAGGFVGCAYGNVIFENCTNNGDVSETSGYGAGGIVGFATGYDDNETAPAFINCKNTGNISSTVRAGGIAGSLGIEGGMGYYNLTATFTGCSNTGTISGTQTDPICGATVNYSGQSTENLTVVIN